MTFTRTHSEEAYDEYKTDDGLHRITVAYENGKFTRLQIRAYISVDGKYTGTYAENDYANLDEINQLITTLHAAVAGVHKHEKGLSSAKNNQ